MAQGNHTVLAIDYSVFLTNEQNKIADTINAFKFDRTDLSPPNMTQDQMTARNLAIIDLTNKLADVIVGPASHMPQERDAFMTLALRRRI